ncbi:acyl-CoA dehydrogenase family protein [Bradyrhizobium sp. Arg68]|uniref:acyl-CoA dehydrogenase family protein n=1 Tax=Bradyrhizobium ivorense TaxID=2511166 RepID=UPI0027E3A544|nr:acyl-CoA dehydrogenase family protein [Bradyrhizobium ivorense]MCC8934966.1 acyl-CoA dehydrogenase family protein [Bradyrhizobium ivorense]
MSGFSAALCCHIERAREWGQAEVRPAGLEADRNGAPLPADHPYFTRFVAWRRAHPLPAEDDGMPEGHAVRMAVLSEENAYWDRGMGVAAPGPGLPTPLVVAMGTPEQRERFLAPFRTTGTPRWAAFALTEPGGGSDTSAFRTRAIRTDRGYLLNGSKCFIGNAARADWVLVQANLDPDKGRAGQRAFFVERGTPGMTGIKIENKMGLRAYESVSFILEHCEVPRENLLGGELPARGSRSGAYGETMGALNTTRVGVAASAVGLARCAYDETLSFARRSGAISSARVRDRLEDMRRKLRAAWLMTLRAAWKADRKIPNVVDASMAKVFAAETAHELATTGMDIIGLEAGAGECLVEKLFRDAKALNIVEGTGQIQRIIIARKLVGLPR